MNEKNTDKLESELESDKEELRRDLSEISRKAQETKAELSPNNLVRERLFLFSALAFAIGFLMGYRDVPLEEFATPAARAALTTAGIRAGAQVGRRAILAI
jgi:hypothetical protein